MCLCVFIELYVENGNATIQINDNIVFDNTFINLNKCAMIQLICHGSNVCKGLNLNVNGENTNKLQIDCNPLQDSNVKQTCENINVYAPTVKSVAINCYGGNQIKLSIAHIFVTFLFFFTHFGFFGLCFDNSL